MKNHGDICKIDGGKVEFVDCVIGGSPCFPAGTKIITLHGEVPIEDICIGAKVLTHEGRFREVMDTGSHVDSLVRLSDGTHEILCTENHPFRSLDKDNAFKIDWTSAKDMVGLYWLYIQDGPGFPCDWHKVILCAKTDITCEVFNLEVDEDNSYVANRLVVHNCQNLSVAGNRKGLEGNESRLFLEQMRLICEMRIASLFTKPRYMVLENVVGLLNCSKGRDFQCVLNECVQACMLGKIKEQNDGKSAENDETNEDGKQFHIPDVPMPKDGKWSKSGILYDDMGRWSIAWRVHDAQYWGVAQRRRRLALVCDFGGMSAPEVLFEQQSVQRNFDEGDTQVEGSSKVVDGSIAEPNQVWDARGNGNGKLCSTITGDHDNRITDYTNVVVQKETTYSINGDAHESGMSVMSEMSHALKVTTKESIIVKQHSYTASDPSYPCICIGNGQAHVTENYTEEVSQTLNCMHDPMTILESDNRSSYKVRRLTPLECTRLQGYPDGWVDIGDWVDSKGKRRKEADAPKYKALGNSIALPFWKWLCGNIVGELRNSGQSTSMASLFDGIGGFPLCWSEATGNQDDVLWVSEIEEFPLAVTRHHFARISNTEV